MAQQQNGVQLYRGGAVLERMGDLGYASAQPPAIVQAAQGSCGVPTRIDVSGGVLNVPNDAINYLCWLMKGIRNSPASGAASSTPLRSPEIILPYDGDFEVGPDLQPPQAMGKFFPFEWATEAIGRGIYRIKCDFEVRIISGSLTPEMVINSAQNLEFRVIQIGTEDRWRIVCNIGDSQDAAKSALIPAAGGFFLPEGQEIIPWNPTTMAYDLAGTLIGGPGDSYGITAIFRSWFKDVSCYQ